MESSEAKTLADTTEAHGADLPVAQKVAGAAQQQEKQLDAQVRGMEALKVSESSVACLATLLTEARQLLLRAEQEVALRKLKVSEIEERLEEARKEEKLAEIQKMTTAEKEKRRAEIRRKWRVLGMKVRVGITANIVKRRKVNDAVSFMEKETEAVAKGDLLDMEGKCERKQLVKKRWRRGGVAVGFIRGLDDCAF